MKRANLAKFYPDFRKDSDLRFAPACPVGRYVPLGLIYDGTFSGKLIKGDGVTVALLRKNGIKIISGKECQER